MRGESVAAWNAPLDGMFLCSGARGAGSRHRWPEKGARWFRATTIGIGDGGNEIGMGVARAWSGPRSEEHTSELQSQSNIVCRLLLEKKNSRPFYSPP